MIKKILTTILAVATAFSIANSQIAPVSVKAGGTGTTTFNCGIVSASSTNPLKIVNIGTGLAYNCASNTLSSSGVSTSTGNINDSEITLYSSLSTKPSAPVLNTDFTISNDGKIVSVVDGGNTWTQTAQTTGTFNSLLNTGTQLLASANNGIYKSTDGGNTWTVTNQTTGYFNSLINTGTQLLAGSFAGIYKSTDNGNTWTQTAQTTGTFNSLLNTGNQLLASSGVDNGIYKSTDGGNTWTQTNQTTGYFISLLNTGTQLLAGSDNGIYKSTDGGNTWTLTNQTTGFFNFLFNTGTQLLAGSLAGIYKSTDGGNTWTLTNQTTGTFRSLLNTGTQLLAGSGSNNGIYKSTDGGNTWTVTNQTTGFFNSLLNTGTQLFAGSGSNNGIYKSSLYNTWTQTNQTTGSFFSFLNTGTQILAGSGSNNGIYKSIDGGNTWTQTSRTTGYFYSLLNTGTQLVAGSNNGIYKSTDGGNTWTLTNQTTGTFNYFLNTGTQILAGSGGIGIYKSTDNGNTWTQTSQTTGFFYYFLNTGTQLLAGSFAGIYKSTDNGNTWTQTAQTTGTFNSLLNTGTQILAASNPGIYKSTDGGNTWTQTAQTTGTFNSLLNTGTQILAASNPGIYKSTDGGNTWTLTSQTTGTFHSLLNTGTQLLAGSDNGIYKSNLNTWNPSPTGANYKATIRFTNTGVGTYSSIISDVFNYNPTNPPTNTLIGNNTNNVLTLSDTNGNSTSTIIQVGEVYRKVATSTISIPLAYSLGAGTFNVTTRQFDVIGGINGTKLSFTQNITATQNSNVFTLSETIPANIVAGDYIEINNIANIYKITSISGNNITVNKNYTGATTVYTNFEVFKGTITTGNITGITNTATYQTALVTALTDTWRALNNSYTFTNTVPSGFNVTTNGSFSSTTSVPVNPLGEIYVVDVTASLPGGEANYVLYNQNQLTPPVWSASYSVNGVAKDVIDSEIAGQLVAGNNISLSTDRATKKITINGVGQASTTNTLTSNVNTLTSNVNNVSATTTIINSLLTTFASSTRLLTTTINGVSTTTIIDITSAVSTSTGNINDSEITLYSSLSTKPSAPALNTDFTISNDGKIVSVVTGGNTWTQTNQTTGSFYSFLNTGTQILAASNPGIYKSTDGGQTWTLTSQTTGTFNYFLNTGTQLLAGSNNGIYKSTDGGNTWTLTNQTTGYFISLLNTGTQLLAGSNNGIYKSTDGGQTWTVTNQTTGYFLSLLNTGTQILAGSGSNNGIYKSIDGGNTWTQTSRTTGYFYSLLNTGTQLVAGSDNNGIYKSTDNGNTWTLTNQTTGSFLSLLNTGTQILAGSGSNNGIYKSTDGGNTWTQTNQTTGYFLSLLNTGTQLLAGSGIGIYKSSLNTWTPSPTGANYKATIRFTNTGVGTYSLIINNAEPYINGDNFQASTFQFVNTGNAPRQLIMDSGGNLYTANNASNTITKITPLGVATIFATVGTNPYGMVFDTTGNLYVANTGSNNVSKITPAGVVTTFGTTGISPLGITIDNAGNLYTANFNANTVSKITPAGVSTTFATVGSNPYGITIDNAGNLYTANYTSSNVSKITPAGVVSTFGSVGTFPYGITVDSNSNVYTANDGSNNITRLTPAGVATTFSVGQKPRGIVIGSDGNIYTTNTQSDDLWVTNPTTGISYPLSNLANYNGLDPWGIVIDATGTIYTSNAVSNNVLKITQPNYNNNKYLTLDNTGKVILNNVSNSSSFNSTTSILTTTINGVSATTSIVGVADSLLEITDSTTSASTRIQTKNQTNTCVGNTINAEVICANKGTTQTQYDTQMSANNYNRAVYNTANGYYMFARPAGIDINTDPTDPTTPITTITATSLFGAGVIGDIAFSYDGELFVIGIDGFNVKIAKLSFVEGQVLPTATKLSNTFTAKGCASLNLLSSINDIAVKYNSPDNYTIAFVGNTIQPNESFCVMSIDLNTAPATASTTNYRTWYNGITYGTTFINAIEFDRTNVNRLLIANNREMRYSVSGGAPTTLWTNPNFDTNLDAYTDGNTVWWTTTAGDTYSTTYNNSNSDIVKYPRNPNNTYTNVYGIGVDDNNKLFQFFYGSNGILIDNYYVVYNLDDITKLNGVLDLSSTTEIINITSFLPKTTSRLSVFSLVENIGTTGAGRFTVGTNGGAVTTLFNNVNISPPPTGSSAWTIPAGIWRVEVSANYNGIPAGSVTVLTKFGIDFSITGSGNSNNLYFSTTKIEGGGDNIGGSQSQYFVLNSATIFYLTRFTGSQNAAVNSQINPGGDFQLIFEKLN